MNYRGYHFFIGDLELPYAPSKLKVTIGSKNQTVDLINGNEINILKSPKLTEIEFDVELPRGRQYAFANELTSSKTYTDYFEKLMVQKKAVKLVITRPNPAKTSSGIGGTIEDFESTSMTVTLEGYSMTEDAENAYDVVVSLKFKEYCGYGSVIQTTTTTNKQSVQTTTKPSTDATTYTVVKGDCLWNLARKFYGNGAKYKTIYYANEAVIEAAAKKHGLKSSWKGQTPGHWIYPGTKLVIPAL